MRILLIFSAIIFSIGCNTSNKKNMIKQKFNFQTDYNQFYLTSDGGGFLSGEMDSDEKAFNDRLGIENNGLVIFTESYGNIKGDIEVLEKQNVNQDYSDYDHIVEGGINVESGELQILNSPDSQLELTIKVNPGKYRVRVYSSNLASVKESDLPHDTDNDYYHIEVWKSDDMERSVLKQYKK